MINLDKVSSAMSGHIINYYRWWCAPIGIYRVFYSSRILSLNDWGILTFFFNLLEKSLHAPFISNDNNIYNTVIIIIKIDMPVNIFLCKIHTYVTTTTVHSDHVSRYYYTDTDFWCAADARHLTFRRTRNKINILIFIFFFRVFPSIFILFNATTTTIDVFSKFSDSLFSCNGAY